MIHFVKSFSPFIGQGCLLGASIATFFQIISPFKRSSFLDRHATPLMTAENKRHCEEQLLCGNPGYVFNYWPFITFTFVAIAFSLLLWAHISSDFSYLNVIQHSHTLKPFLYKISGVWANHEGSMLLWVLFLCLYNLIASLTLPDDLKNPTNRILACLTLGFLLFIILACDPFTTVLNPPLEGEDLNPLLQDPSLAIHPPILYLGQVGCSIPFALCLVALLQKDLTALTIQWIRLFTLIAWSFLTTGLALGSFWAYYELGWGGWWFWDPVENIALLPWLTSTALIHCLSAAQKQQTLQRTSLFLGLLTFGFCLFGLFFVRSGLLTSIHSFTVDPERGHFLLILLMLFFVLPFLLWVMRFRLFRANSISSPFSKSGMIALNAVFLLCGTATLFLSILYPLILGWFGKSLTIGTPYFSATFIPMMLPLVFLMGLGVWMSYLETPLKPLFKKLLPVGSASILSVILAWQLLPNATLSAFLMLGASVWLMGSSFLYILKNPKTFKTLGVGTAHFGMGLMILGMVWASQGDVEKEVFLKINQSTEIADYTFTLKSLSQKDSPNYKANRAFVSVSKGDRLITILEPEKRYYWTQKTIHTETSLYSTFLSHLHAMLLDDERGPYRLRFYYKPLINLLWFGVGLMTLGGVLAALNRFKKIMILMVMTTVPVFAETIGQTATSLYKQIICPVCSGQTLADSGVEEAVLMKEDILRKLKAGKTEAEILDELIRVYGAKIVRNPPLEKSTLPLWLLPWALLLSLISVILFKWCHKSG
ncbi:MAG: cytochrome c biogenesis protein CcsA [Alphaproteobacteria bacterium]|nr:cytochrome c biogenesis protein CcsA [Alphaproteobacteria bacterium]